MEHWLLVVLVVLGVGLVLVRRASGRTPAVPAAMSSRVQGPAWSRSGPTPTVVPGAVGASAASAPPPTVAEGRGGTAGAEAPVRSTIRAARSVARYTPAQVQRSLAAGTAVLVDSLLAQGRLRRSGPVTDAEVWAMVFVAVATGDLLCEVLERRSAGAHPSPLVIPARA